MTSVVGKRGTDTALCLPAVVPFALLPWLSSFESAFQTSARAYLVMSECWVCEKKRKKREVQKTRPKRTTGGKCTYELVDFQPHLRGLLLDLEFRPRRTRLPIVQAWGRRAVPLSVLHNRSQASQRRGLKQKETAGRTRSFASSMVLRSFSRRSLFVRGRLGAASPSSSSSSSSSLFSSSV